MSMLAVTVAGLALLFVFILVSRLANRTGGGAGGAKIFIWVWLLIAAVYCGYGIFKGFSVLLEAGVFAVIFGVPALVAWFAARKLGKA